MRRIHNDETTVIEHWLPVTVDGEKVLDYGNMMACCDGGRHDDTTKKVLCCDAAKANQTITISPYDKQQMQKIRYRRNGFIQVYPEDSTMINDINNVLKLNGDIDKNGEFISDTATGLIHGRSQTYREYEMFISRLIKKNKPVGPSVRKKLDELLNADEYVEYVGVWAYFLKRKLGSQRG